MVGCEIDRVFTKGVLKTQKQLSQLSESFSFYSISVHLGSAAGGRFRRGFIPDISGVCCLLLCSEPTEDRGQVCWGLLVRRLTGNVDKVRHDAQCNICCLTLLVILVLARWMWPFFKKKQM